MMSRLTILTVILTALLSVGTLHSAEPRQWRLVWSEEFAGDTIDTATWSKIPRGGADWNRHMSAADSLYEIGNGILTLHGVNNTSLEADTARYLTGGLWTKGLHSFEPGRIEVKARLGSARGAWPAIWLLPADTVRFPWPKGGEIDMMEHLNYDSIVYQTVHSEYTLYQGGENEPPHFATATADTGEWNVYGVDIMPDELIFHLNGVETFRYPRTDCSPEQYPYHVPVYLLIDMQIEGGWVGKADPASLPVRMEVDWVRHYLAE